MNADTLRQDGFTIVSHYLARSFINNRISGVKPMIDEERGVNNWLPNMEASFTTVPWFDVSKALIRGI